MPHLRKTKTRVKLSSKSSGFREIIDHPAWQQSGLVLKWRNQNPARRSCQSWPVLPPASTLAPASPSNVCIRTVHLQPPDSLSITLPPLKPLSRFILQPFDFFLSSARILVSELSYFWSSLDRFCKGWFGKESEEEPFLEGEEKWRVRLLLPWERWG